MFGWMTFTASANSKGTQQHDEIDKNRKSNHIKCVQKDDPGGDVPRYVWWALLVSSQVQLNIGHLSAPHL